MTHTDIIFGIIRYWSQWIFNVRLCKILWLSELKTFIWRRDLIAFTRYILVLNLTVDAWKSWIIIKTRLWNSRWLVTSIGHWCCRKTWSMFVWIIHWEIHIFYLLIVWSDEIVSIWVKNTIIRILVWYVSIGLVCLES